MEYFNSDTSYLIECAISVIKDLIGSPKFPVQNCSSVSPYWNLVQMIHVASNERVAEEITLSLFINEILGNILDTVTTTQCCECDKVVMMINIIKCLHLLLKPLRYQVTNAEGFQGFKHAWNMIQVATASNWCFDIVFWVIWVLGTRS